MIDTDLVLQRIINWQKGHGGSSTDLVVKQHRAVFEAAERGELPKGTFLPLQCWAQLTGKEEEFDLIDEYPEVRLAYSQNDRWDPDEKMDCSSWVSWNVRMWTGRTIVPAGVADYTETQWRYNKSKAVPWLSRRAFDIPFWNFKAFIGRTASHVGLLVGNGRLCHTTSPTNPLRIESDGYASSARVGVVRFLTAAEYESMFVGSTTTGGEDMLVRNDPRKQAVAQWQRVLALLGYDLGDWTSIIDGARDGSDGDYGATTVLRTSQFQRDANVQTKNEGLADDVTILAAAWLLSQVQPADTSALEAVIAAKSSALGQIETIAAANK